MPTINRFEDIRAWQTARELTQRIYLASNQGPFARDHGLRDQMRRASVSIMSNIAEGFESDTQPQFIRFLGYAKASAGELRAQLYVALDAAYLTQDEFAPLFDLTEKAASQLTRFVTYLRDHPPSTIRELPQPYELEEDRWNVETLERSHVETFPSPNVPTSQRSNVQTSQRSNVPTPPQEPNP
jgi:four helix bundle protein